MNFGLLFPFRNSPDASMPFTELYRKHIELAVEAEELGYDTIWLTEHHFVPDGYSPALMPIGAAVAVRTRKIRIGTFVLLLPMHNPLRVAEDAATVDILSNGRLDLGLGQGYRVEELNAFNIPRRERAGRLEEGTEVIRRAWTESNFSFEGKHYKFSNVTVVPNVVQKPHPPIWLGARGPKSIARAARHGYHLAGTGSPRDEELYHQALRDNGRRPEDYSIAQLRFGFIGARADKAWDDAEAPVHYMISCYAKWLHDASDLPGDSAFGANLPPVGELRRSETVRFLGEPLLIGTPDQVVAMLEEYQQRTRFTHLVFGMSLPGIDPRKIRNSMRLFAKEVMPHLRRRRRRSAAAAAHA